MDYSYQSGSSQSVFSTGLSLHIGCGAQLLEAAKQQPRVEKPVLSLG